MGKWCQEYSPLLLCCAVLSCVILAPIVVAIVVTMSTYNPWTAPEMTEQEHQRENAKLQINFLKEYGLYIFGIVFAIILVIIIAYILKRKKICRCK